jgi:WD40 repeat protein
MGSNWKNLRERVLISDWRGRSLRQLVKLRQGTLINSVLRASQDGKWVAFVTVLKQPTTYVTARLCLIHLTVGERLHFSCPVRAVELYAFSPDSQWLAYSYNGVVHLYQPSSGRNVIASPTVTTDTRVAWTADSKGVFYGAFPLGQYNSPMRAGLRYAGIDGSTWVVGSTKNRAIFALGRVSGSSILLWSMRSGKDYLFDPLTHRLDQVSAPVELISIAGHPGDVTFSGDGRKMAILDSQRHWRICPTGALAAGLRWSQCTQLPNAPGGEERGGPGTFSSILNFNGSAAIDYRVTAHGYNSSLVNLATGSSWPLYSYTYKNQ